MSHFTVIVIGEDVEDQLEPYAEQDFEEKYAEFYDLEPEYMIKYETENVLIYEYEDGSFSAEYKRKDKPVVSERQGTFKELYSSFDEFMQDYAGYPEKDPKTNKYGYWYNPNAKWDWYQEGGRWSGYFRVKEDSLKKYPSAQKSSSVNSILLKDLDINWCKESARSRAEEEYAKLEEVLNGRPLPSWTKTLQQHNGDVEAARQEYWQVPTVKDLSAANLIPWGCTLEELYDMPKEAYVKKAEKAVLVPFAVLSNGTWYEKGTMGWFGLSRNDMPQEDWESQFWSLIANLPPDTRLTLVDCHI